MNELNIVIVLAGALSGVLVWLLIPGGRSPKVPAGSAVSESDSLPIARHYQHFPQIRQALSAVDANYLQENAPKQVTKQALRQRREVARHFLSGLREDFSNLARLGRMVAALSPEVSREQETQRLLLTLKFQILYSVVWLRLCAGNAPLRQIEGLTGLVGQLAQRMDEAMAQISALSSNQLSRNHGT